MKRAIFKFGQAATIRSFSDVHFVVKIDKAWLNSDEWSALPMTILSKENNAKRGTSVEVRDLYTGIATEFRRSEFVEEVRRAIARQYSIIIGKGFEVSVSAGFSNDGNYSKASAIPAETFRLLVAPIGDKGVHVAPYVYRGKINEVEVEIYAGLYRKLPDEDEQEQEQETSGSADDAGWVVACNDRVVIWKDRSRLTGWGEAGVPNFHGQFIAITGIVLLRSTDPSLLPLTTTKRGVDVGSDLYSKAKDLMRDATKALVTFTNKWKKFPERLEDLYLGSSYIDLSALQARSVALRAVHNLPSMQRSTPKLPVPAALTTDARISFAAPKVQVASLAEIYFQDRAAKPGKVGQHAFEQEYARHIEAAE